MSLPNLQNLIFYNCNFQNFSFTIANQFHNWQTPTSQMSQSRGGNEKASLANLQNWQNPISQFLVKANGPQSIAPRLSCYLRIKPNGHKWGSIVVEISPPPNITQPPSHITPPLCSAQNVTNRVWMMSFMGAPTCNLDLPCIHFWYPSSQSQRHTF